MVPESRNRDEKGLVDTGWERAGGMNWESGTAIYTIMCEIRS